MCEHLIRHIVCNCCDNSETHLGLTGECEFDGRLCDTIGPCPHEFYCPICKIWFRVPQEVREGERAQCPKCGAIIGWEESD